MRDSMKNLQIGGGEDEIEVSEEDDNFNELMDQLHPLKDSAYVDIFPALKVFQGEEEEDEQIKRQTMITKKL